MDQKMAAKIKNDFNDGSYNQAAPGMEKTLESVQIFEKDGKKTAYVFDFTLFTERSGISSWVKDTYVIDKVSFGNNDNNPFNAIALSFNKKANEDKGAKVYKGPLYLPEATKPDELKPNPYVAYCPYM